METSFIYEASNCCWMLNNKDNNEKFNNYLVEKLIKLESDLNTHMFEYFGSLITIKVDIVNSSKYSVRLICTYEGNEYFILVLANFLGIELKWETGELTQVDNDVWDCMFMFLISTVKSEQII